MPRPKKKKLSFDEDSVNKLLQEIYEDTHNTRAKIKRLFNKWEVKVQDGSEVAAIGDQIVKLISAEAKNQDQKIMLLKYLKEVVYNKNSAGNNSPETDSVNGEMTAEKKNGLLKMVQQEVDRKEINSRKG